MGRFEIIASFATSIGNLQEEFVFPLCKLDNDFFLIRFGIVTAHVFIQNFSAIHPNLYAVITSE